MHFCPCFGKLSAGVLMTAHASRKCLYAFGRSVGVFLRRKCCLSGNCLEIGKLSDAFLPMFWETVCRCADDCPCFQKVSVCFWEVCRCVFEEKVLSEWKLSGDWET